MKKEDVKKLPNGLYRVFWKSGGGSEAAVGMTSDGSRWLAPTNWTAPTLDQKYWQRVERVERIS